MRGTVHRPDALYPADIQHPEETAPKDQHTAGKQCRKDIRLGGTGLAQGQDGQPYIEQGLPLPGMPHQTNHPHQRADSAEPI